MKMELLIHVHARFLKRHSSEPVHGKNISVRIYDKDIFTDDFLGETSPDTDGNVKFTINPKSYRTEDSLAEQKPDFYLTVMDAGKEIFRTPVASNIDFTKEGDFNSAEGETIDLGAFLIDL